MRLRSGFAPDPTGELTAGPLAGLIRGPVASSVEKVRGTGSCNFPTDGCKFPTVVGAQNFNFATKFSLPPNEGFPAPNLVFLRENFPTRRKFRQAKI